MASNLTKIEKKRTLVKSYAKQCQLEKAIEKVLENREADTQLSLLGKLEDSYFVKNSSPLNEKEYIKNYWSRLLGIKEDFGFFFNPEIGTIFTVGSLVGTFLQDVEGTKLAELSAGPKGILRGLGIASDQTDVHIKTLIEGGFLMIMRGYNGDLKKLEAALISLER